VSKCNKAKPTEFNPSQNKALWHLIPWWKSFFPQLFASVYIQRAHCSVHTYK
jgi:hypothetical protein